MCLEITGFKHAVISVKLSNVPKKPKKDRWNTNSLIFSNMTSYKNWPENYFTTSSFSSVINLLVLFLVYYFVALLLCIILLVLLLLRLLPLISLPKINTLLNINLLLNIYKFNFQVFYWLLYLKSKQVFFSSRVLQSHSGLKQMDFEMRIKNSTEVTD